MAGYKELIEDYDLTETSSEVSGVRSFVEVTGGTSSLPAIGDKFVDRNSVIWETCLAKGRSRKIFYYERGGVNDWAEKIIVNYSTKTETSSFTTADADERRYQLGGEILAIDDPKAHWTWHIAGGAVNQPLFKANAMGSLTRQVTFASAAAKATAVGVWESQMGTINAAAFENHRIGSVLFNGVDGGTQYNSVGVKTWVFRLQFTFRIIRDETVAISRDDWLYLWNKTASSSGIGAWDLPKDANGKFLYAKSDFTALF